MNEILPHRELIDGYSGGRLTILVDRARAAEFVSKRMMLPFVLLPFFGSAVALALIGKYLAAVLLFVAGLALRFAVRRTSADFVMQRALREGEFYFEAAKAGVVRVQPRAESGDGDSRSRP